MVYYNITKPGTYTLNICLIESGFGSANDNNDGANNLVHIKDSPFVSYLSFFPNSLPATCCRIKRMYLSASCIVMCSLQVILCNVVRLLVSLLFGSFHSDEVNQTSSLGHTRSRNNYKY